MSSDGSISPTPSMENRSNTMHDAISSLMGVQEESYDEFIQGFTYLKKEDITKQQMKKKEVLESKSEKPNTGTCKSNDIVQTSTEDKENDFELETEVLQTGTVTSVMSQNPDTGRHASLKFDNFMEEDSNSEDDGEGGYVASFNTTDTSTSNKEPRVVTTSQDEMNPGETIPSGLQIKEKLAAKTLDSDTMTASSSDKEGENIEPILNPGEVDFESDLPPMTEVTVTDRRLEFSTSYPLETSEKNQSEQVSSEDTCVDEVEPFSLDVNFDYDNVVLTPKFSDADIQLMRTLSKQTEESCKT